MSISPSRSILSTEALESYVAAFNRNDQELYRQHIPNDRAAAWMNDNIPLFECPDKEIEEIYHFRWWTFRKHLKETPDGFVVTEFLPPVPWAGRHNTISCAAAHHFREGRWLRDTRYLDDYARFWLRGGGELRTHLETNRGYSFWIAESLLAQARVTGRFDLCLELLPDRFTLDSRGLGLFLPGPAPLPWPRTDDPLRPHRREIRARQGPAHHLRWPRSYDGNPQRTRLPLVVAS